MAAAPLVVVSAAVPSDW